MATSTTKERVQNAYTAMKRLGIRAENVRPVLKRLLILYDKNWELIEEDNYRTLADAIFEYEDDKVLCSFCCKLCHHLTFCTFPKCGNWN